MLDCHRDQDSSTINYTDCAQLQSFLLLPIFLKPLILQQLLRSRPIPPIHHHDFPNEFLILLADLSFRRHVEWRCLRLWDLLHKVQNSCDCIRGRNLFVFRRERTKVSELPLKDLQPVLFMAVGDSARAEKVEVATVDKTYKLQVGSVLFSFVFGQWFNTPQSQTTKCRLRCSKAFP
jgi:hypothetical protein